MSDTFKIYGKMVQIKKNIPQEELRNTREERGEQGLGRYSREAERRAYRGEQNIPENSFAQPLFVGRGGEGRGRAPEIGWRGEQQRRRG